MWQKGLKLQENKWVFCFAEANELYVVTGRRKHLFLRLLERRRVSVTK
jgi:hypothetical protein